MDPVRFRQGRLMAWGTMAFAVAAIYLAILHDPGAQDGGDATLFHTGFGQFVLTPLIVTALAAFGWRALARGLGDAPAIVAGEDGLTVRTLWQDHRLAWADVDAVGTQSVRTRGVVTRLLTIRTSTRVRPISLSLRFVAIEPDALPRLIARIEELQRLCMRKPVTPQPKPTLAQENEGDGFDPDAIIARYLAERDTVVAAPGDPAAIEPAVAAPRPVFGRKARLR